MTPWGLVNCKVFGPQGPSLTNRVSELFTHGSVGGVGRKPGPYPAPTHDYTLVDALIEALGELGYTPAADELFKLRGTDYDATATRAVSKIVPERLAAELLATAKDTKTDSYFRERTLVTLCNLAMTSRVRELVPLLDDVTPIVYSRPMPGPEWRVCDRAAVSIATLLGWEHPTMLKYLRPEQREELMKRAREWQNRTHRRKLFPG